MNKFNNGVVYVKKISPETILDDYSWLIDKAKLKDNFEKDITTFLKVNISWDRYYPGCSSAPWQIEGVVDKLLKLGSQPKSQRPKSGMASFGSPHGNQVLEL